MADCETGACRNCGRCRAAEGRAQGTATTAAQQNTKQIQQLGRDLTKAVNKSGKNSEAAKKIQARIKRLKGQ